MSSCVFGKASSFLFFGWFLANQVLPFLVDRVHLSKSINSTIVVLKWLLTTAWNMLVALWHALQEKTVLVIRLSFFLQEWQDRAIYAFSIKKGKEFSKSYRLQLAQPLMAWCTKTHASSKRVCTKKE